MEVRARLLVVDDEEVVCQSCTRVLENEGFQVETNCSSVKGLEQASREDYAMVIVDIKMPEMDGLQFIEELRKGKPATPVIIITGHADVASVTSAMRLGAADYIPKPFTPQELAEAVRKLWNAHRTTERPRREGAEHPEAQPPRPQAWAPLTAEYRFLDNAWFQAGLDGSVRTGGFLSREQARSVKSVQLPRVGDEATRGLPLAALAGEGGSRWIIPSPVSGTITEVNDALGEDPDASWADPCHKGWIARIRPNRLADDARLCRTRDVVLASLDEARNRKQKSRLSFLGCTVHTARTADDILATLKNSGSDVLVLDAASYGERGPQVVKTVNEAGNRVKTVVYGSSEDREAAYRAVKIFYYTVEPFADEEFIDILHAAFRPASRRIPEWGTIMDAFDGWLQSVRDSEANRNGQAKPPDSVCRISTTTPDGRQALLVAPTGVLLDDYGLTQELLDGLSSRGYRFEVALNSDQTTSDVVAKTPGGPHRVVLLDAKDMGRIPGTLVRVPPAEPGGATTLAVQPPHPEGRVLVFDRLTMQTLAELILKEMNRS